MMNSTAMLVHPIHFEDYGLKDFERLVLLTMFALTIGVVWNGMAKFTVGHYTISEGV